MRLGTNPTVKEVYTRVLNKGMIEPASKNIILLWNFQIAKKDTLKKRMVIDLS